MTPSSVRFLPPALAATLLADYRPVRRLSAPTVRVLAVVPLGILVLVAAPAVFGVRLDAPRLGWLWSWGVSAAQLLVGLLVVGAAFRDAVPGRAWRTAQVALWVVGPVAMVLALTWVTWATSPTLLRGSWWPVAAMCVAGSLASALPIVALSAVMVLRAYPLRPAATGALLGLGAGLMADAGWRLFCHFSAPAHVLVAHGAGIGLACVAGAVLTRRLKGPPRE